MNVHEQAWAARADAARTPGRPGQLLLAVVFVVALPVMDRLWTLVEDTRAWIGRA